MQNTQILWKLLLWLLDLNTFVWEEGQGAAVWAILLHLIPQFRLGAWMLKMRFLKMCSNLKYLCLRLMHIYSLVIYKTL